MPASRDGDTPSDKVLAMMECIADSAAPLSITEVATRLELPVPTAHRLATHLTSRGYLKRSPGSKRLRIGPRLVALGLKTVGGAVTTDRPRMTLVALARQLGEQCHIGVVHDDLVQYIDSVRADRALGLQFQPGHSAPVYCTSIGKLHLADLDDDALGDLLDRLTIQSFTANTLASKKSIRAEVQRVRQRGWASTNCEFTPGVVGCAVAIRDGRGRMIAGLGVAAPTARVTVPSLRQMVEPMQDAAAKISAALTEDTDALP